MSKDKPNYKDTLNLPKTDFDMRAGLLKKEPVLQQQWKDEDLYQRILDSRSDATDFLLHDGPPFANGNIHMGTAMNKVLKDMVVKVKTMQGFRCRYVPGWDCHGQPIEQKIVEQLGETFEQTDRAEIRRLCQDYARTFQALQSEQFQRLGVLGEFDNPYLTMDPAYEASVMEVFARLVDEGLVYRQLKPVHWSIENRTALADAELEYQDRQDTSVYVAFQVDGAVENLPHQPGEPVHLVIWTTTPWTLPGNRAVAVHPDYEYVLVHSSAGGRKGVYILAKDLLGTVSQAIRDGGGDLLASGEVIGTYRGAELVKMGITYKHPVYEGMTCPLVQADYVTLEDGTGLVHTAPGHGTDDYLTGLRHGLEIACPVKGDGTYDETAPEWLVGKSVWQANKLVTEHLDELGKLILATTITHSYPHDWRSKTPTIFRATEQWFVGLDRKMTGQGVSLRALATEVVDRPADQDGVQFIPAWGRNRLAGMLANRPDWCLSRQRSWGLPIPCFYNADDEPLLTAASVRAVATVVAAEGSMAWFQKSAAELLADYDPAEDPDVDDPAHFPVDQLTVGRDIFDVWFESGSSWFAVCLQQGLAERIPVEMYLEGSDQHRGWFQLSMLPALGATGKPPFRTLLTHGFVVTEDGHKMSKSLGNTIDVIEQLDKRGADILRLWIASQDYRDDVRCSESLIAQAEDAYRKIRNTLRFCMGVCKDYDPACDAAEPADHSVDKWMRLQLAELVRNVRQAYERYEFHRASRLIYEFCTVQASSVYLAAVKDRLYCESPAANRRRASQGVCHELLTTLVKLLAPIIPHTAEEAWGHIPNRPADEPDSVHLAMLPDYDEDALELAEGLRNAPTDDAVPAPDDLQPSPQLIWNWVMDLRSQGLVKLEALRNAGVKNPMEAEAIVKVAGDRDDLVAMLQPYLHELEDLLGVGFIRMERADDLGEDRAVLDVADARDKYSRCARSWKRRPDVGANPAYPDLSARDAAVMAELAEQD